MLKMVTSWQPCGPKEQAWSQILDNNRQGGGHHPSLGIMPYNILCISSHAPYRVIAQS